MTTFRFFTNLRPATVASFERSGYTPDAWLLSSHRLDNETESLAEWVRDGDRDLFADNGTHPFISQVVDLHAERLAPLARDIRRLRRSLPDKRRIPMPSEVPRELTERAREAAHTVAADVDRVLGAHSLEHVLSAQLTMRPTHLVAREDFAVGCLLSLGLEREITRLPVSWFRARNRITLDFWEAVAGDPRIRGIDVYATLGAMDYNTAKAAADEAARRGVDRVALGFAGINRDSTFAERYLAGQWRTLSGPAPRRYVRVAEIICGIRDGYREAGARLRAFHALGLGARDQFPTLAAGFDWFTQLSTDATSPLHDSVRDRIFYDEETWGDRLHLSEAAEHVLSGHPWPFACPFCPYIKDRFHHDPDAARRWWSSAGERKVTVADLHPDEPLGAALPLFATARGPATSVQTRARTAHNHWVVDRLSDQVPSRKRAEWGLDKLSELEGMRTRATRLGVMASQEVIRTLSE